MAGILFEKNSFYNSLKRSRFARKEKFSVLISKFELKKFPKLYSKQLLNIENLNLSILKA